jgi:hypothetical protein
MTTVADLHSTMDARVWAREFNRVAQTLGYPEMDDGWLIGWFANAIMTGHDHAVRERATTCLSGPLTDEGYFGSGIAVDQPNQTVCVSTTS